MAYITLSSPSGRQNGYSTQTLASGTTTTDVYVDLVGLSEYGLLIPSTVSGVLSFQVSNLSDGTYYTVKDKGGSSTFTVTPSVGTNMAVESDDLNPLKGYRYVKIVSTVSYSSDKEFIWVLKG